MRETLVRLRKGENKTQAEIAELVGISRSFYALIEINLRNPNYGLAKKIAKIFNQDVERIFFDIDDFKMKQSIENTKLVV
ncbi:MAG: transcriptional regulator, family [Pelosinus sp.]|jgi:putative transcriptional regulator|nr:transcriptional regulator, family [Pelosinus sp.]